MSIILELTSWTQFKSVCITTKNLNCQYVDFNGYYELYGPDANSLVWHANILKDPNSPGSDQTDFETNYKANFNLSIGTKTNPFATPSFTFNGSGVSGTVTAGSTGNIDFQVPGTAGTIQYVNGAVFFTSGNAVVGDWLSVKVIDINNILGHGANFVVSTYVAQWYVDPSQQIDLKNDYAAQILAGLFIRVAYTSTGSVINGNVTVNINYRIHSPTVAQTAASK